jgi:hypothetical protein
LTSERKPVKSDKRGRPLTSHELTGLCSSIDEICATGIFRDHRDPLFKAAFTLLIIQLNELLQNMDRQTPSKRITKPSSLRQTSGAKDITDVINFMRASLCHIASPRREWKGDTDDGSRVTVGWMFASGGMGKAIRFANRDFPDADPGDLMIAVGGSFITMLADLAPLVNEALEWARAASDER